jgi:hypothetical protein
VNGELVDPDYFAIRYFATSLISGWGTAGAIRDLPLTAQKAGQLR